MKLCRRVLAILALAVMTFAPGIVNADTCGTVPRLQMYGLIGYMHLYYHLMAAMWGVPVRLSNVSVTDWIVGPLQDATVYGEVAMEDYNEKYGTDMRGDVYTGTVGMDLCLFGDMPAGLALNYRTFDGEDTFGTTSDMQTWRGTVYLAKRLTDWCGVGVIGGAGTSDEDVDFVGFTLKTDANEYSVSPFLVLGATSGPWTFYSGAFYLLSDSDQNYNGGIPSERYTTEAVTVANSVTFAVNETLSLTGTADWIHVLSQEEVVGGFDIDRDWYRLGGRVGVQVTEALNVSAGAAFYLSNSSYRINRYDVTVAFDF
jgi:hypothetical protein